MAINKNHEFEDLEGVKCAIVEKNVRPERVAFLKSILELNSYVVIVVKTPPPKVTAAKPASSAETATDKPTEPTPTAPAALETSTVGVTDVMFNAINAIFGRSLKTQNGHIVTLAYWEQKENQSQDEIPYFENKAV